MMFERWLNLDLLRGTEKTWITVLFLAILFLISLSVYEENVGRNVDRARELESVRIEEYEGKRLSSLDDFRENSIKGPQRIEIGSYRLRVTDTRNNSKEYTYEQIINNLQKYKKVVTLNCVEGWSVTILWEGVLVRDVIGKNATPPDAKVIIFHAYDGYTTSLPVDYIMEKDIIMAYRMNNVTLPPERGFPFELVAESKWGYKWIKWITEIELSNKTDYRGYWESRGYSNSGDMDKGFFEE